MPNIPTGGRNSKFESNFRDKFAPLKTRLKIIENDLKALTAKIYTSTKKSASYWSGLNKEVNLLYREISAVFNAWSDKNIPAVYAKTIREQSKYIKSLKSVTHKAAMPSTDLINGRASKQIVSTLYDDAVESMLMATNNGRSNMTRVSRLTQQRLLNESYIDITVAQGFESGNLQKAISGLTTAFEQKIIQGFSEGLFVKAGNRRFTPEYYAEMVARVKFHEAQAHATLMMAKNYDTDLVIVSSHNTSTPICLPFEGKIFSISGKDSRFPLLTEIPPFHPNCLHLLFPQFESALSLSGQLQEFSDFSLGKIDRPPRPASFIPVSKRSA
jgi:hypothetical protein